MSSQKLGVLYSPCCLPNRTRSRPRFPGYRRPCLHVICKVEGPSKTARRQSNYQPSLWRDDYIQSLPNGNKDIEANSARFSSLNERMRKLLNDKKEMKDLIELIDALQQLGVAYHFKKEIKEALWDINRTVSEGAYQKYDLCFVSLLFRLLRQDAVTISQDILEGFRDKKGWSVEILHHKTEGVLSLYEASYLVMDGESELEEAREVTTKHLKAVLLKRAAVDSQMTKSVMHALDLPLNWRIPRLHARWFIEAYQKRSNMDPLLLELAKVDFNAVQRLYIKELKVLSGWWNDLGIWQKLPFARDGIVENYFWAVGAASEPRLSTCREVITKASCLITAIDDVYDIHGTLEELELFTDAVNRWEVEAVKQLPDYMKICFLALFNTTNDMAYEVMKKKGLNVIPYLQKAWADLCKRYLVESKWYHHGHMPTFKEYLDNALVSVGGHVALTMAYCTSEHVSERDLETFACRGHDMLWHSSVILRLCNDLAKSTVDEIERGDVPKSVQCYMHEKGVLEERAKEHIKDLIRASWRSLNGVLSSPSPSEEYLKEITINLTRTALCVYQYGEGCSRPDQEAEDVPYNKIIDLYVYKKLNVDPGWQLV